MNRQDILHTLQTKTFDLLVIGGGITGAGIALDATVRGLKTCLIDMQDFAAGTSSRSTKLVHGGLRYLKQLEIGLVAEVGKERTIVYENAPHVTTPEWMLLPIVEGGTFGRLLTAVGLRLYDWLAGVKKSERRRMLSKADTLQQEPLLRSDILRGAGYYVEYKTDDARLTLEIIKEASSRGASPLNYVQCVELLYDNGSVQGVLAQDLKTLQTFEILAKKTVNATGPWVDTIRDMDGSNTGKHLYLTKGVHLVFDQKRFPLQQAVYFDTHDGRMVFAIPRAGKTYVGTTDTHYTEDPTHPVITPADLRYLLAAIDYMFPSLKLQPDDVEASWAGIRPLIYEAGKKESEISRKDEIFLSETGLITIAGGKLTGYRKMAEKVVDQVARELGNTTPCTTDHIRLSGGDPNGSQGLQAYMPEAIAHGCELRLTEEEASRIVHRYGRNAEKIYAILRQTAAAAHPYGLSSEVYGTLVYALEEEWAQTPVDFFFRRTSALLFDLAWVQKWKEAVLRFMADYLHWSEEEQQRHKANLEEEISRMYAREEG